jgi:hypothetical protein
VLSEPESSWIDWQEEYSAVVAGYDRLAGADCRVEGHADAGLAALEAPEPLHSVALASHAAGADVMVRGRGGVGGCGCLGLLHARVHA